ncbi:MAG: MBL fold metallo-hydrolase [Clostridiales bacterium]|nr:MBL fold metallo-hydrolase [Clostridiales bacterium]
MDLSRPWLDYIEPFKIADNLYFVGSIGSSSHIIDTGKGLIMIDSGYPQTLYQVLFNMQKMGLDPKNIKYIVHSHGHYDHLGATKALKELTGAKTFIAKEDEKLANGEIDLSWAKELGAKYYESFQPDVLLNDGDIIKLGNTEIECVLTPGHTSGTMSFFFNVTYKNKTYLAGMHGGVGSNTMKKEFLEKYNLPFSCRTDFLQGLEKVKDKPVEIFLGNHTWNNKTEEKLKTLSPDFNPFINKNEWKEFLNECKNKVLLLME